MNFLNDVKFIAATSGVADFGIGAAVTAFQTPATAGAEDGATYSYTARNATQFESGSGTYDLAGGKIVRTTVEDTSAGFGVKVNFTNAPIIILTPLANDFASVASSGNYNDLSNKPTLGTAAAQNSTVFATAAQGAEADTAVQPGDLGSAAGHAATDFATAAQGAEADTAVQPVDLATVAFSGSYPDLLNKPTIGVHEDTEKNILASTPTLGLTAYATDLQQLMIADGTNWWITSGYFAKDLQNPDLGYIQGSNRSGYGQQYVTDKIISNSAVGGNSNTQVGGLRYNATGLVSTGGPSLQAYFSSKWNNIVAGITLVDLSNILTDTPVGAFIINLFSGNSTLLGLNGRPIVQGYAVSMGAYPASPQIDGGSF